MSKLQRYSSPNVEYKELATYIKEILVEEVDEKIGEYQCGSRKGRSTIEQIFTLREIQAESYEYGQCSYLSTFSRHMTKLKGRR